MAAKTLDASAAVALLFGEHEAEQIAERIRNSSLVAPALLPFEVANACITKIRRHSAQRDGLIAAFGLFDRMDIEFVAVNHAEVLLLADAMNLTAYDASYAWVANKRDAELVTLDRRLAAATADARRR